MTWGWYMLEPWETLLWMAMLAFFFWLVVSACFLNPSSICSTTLAAARKALAEQGVPAPQHRDGRNKRVLGSLHVLVGSLLPTRLPLRSGQAANMLAAVMVPHLLPQVPGSWRWRGDGRPATGMPRQTLVPPGKIDGCAVMGVLPAPLRASKM